MPQSNENNDLEFGETLKSSTGSFGFLPECPTKTPLARADHLIARQRLHSSSPLPHAVLDASRLASVATTASCAYREHHSSTPLAHR